VEDKTMLLLIVVFGFPVSLILFGLLMGRYEKYTHERVIHQHLWILKWLFSSLAYTLLILIGCIFAVLTLGIGGVFILSLFKN
jgi:hypothetical protein